MLHNPEAVWKLVTARLVSADKQTDSYKSEPCLIVAAEPMKCAQDATCTIHYSADLQAAQSTV